MNFGLSTTNLVLFSYKCEILRKFVTFNFGWVALKMDENEMNWVWILCFIFLFVVVSFMVYNLTHSQMKKMGYYVRFVLVYAYEFIGERWLSILIGCELEELYYSQVAWNLYKSNSRGSNFAKKIILINKR